MPKLVRPTVTGQAGEVLDLIRRYQPILSFKLTADLAMPEAAARVHDLRALGFNIVRRIHGSVKFFGRVRRNEAMYSLGSPEWPSTEFIREIQRQFALPPEGGAA
jgi:hypothetical protein